jgi:hypothetical protein
MDTFLARIAQHPLSAQQPVSLAGSLGRVLSALPDMGMPFQVDEEVWEAEGVHVAFGVGYPERGSCLVSRYNDESVAALVYGEVFLPGSAAEAIARAYVSGGVAAVRALDGCFGALVFDKSQRSLVVVSDLIGQRALRFVETPSAVWVAPHDACLVAAGAARVEFDAVSALSCLVLENSIRAISLLRDVTGLEGNDVVRWTRDGGLTRERLPKLELTERLDEGDHRGIQTCREAVVERMVAAAREWVKTSPLIRCELTAGVDSRATLACLLALDVRDKIVAVTSGAPDSRDMKTAIRLARLAGVRHEVLPTSSDDPRHFLENLRLRAFANNGDTDAKRAARPVPTWSPDTHTRVEGSCAEIMRGFLYTYFGLTGVAPDSPEKVASTILARRWRRFASVPTATLELRGQLEARFLECFNEYAGVSRNGNDMADMCHLFERTAHWSSHVRRASWSTTRNVFLVPSAIREAYRLPSPWGANVNAHFNLVTRYFPESRTTLINGSRLIDFEGPGRLRLTSRVASTLLQAVWEKGTKKLAGKKEPSTAALLFAGPLFPLVSDLLGAEGSVATQTLGAAGVRKILSEHQAAHRHPAILGYATTIDVYKQLLLELVPKD